MTLKDLLKVTHTGIIIYIRVGKRRQCVYTGNAVLCKDVEKYLSEEVTAINIGMYQTILGKYEQYMEAFLDKYEE